MLSSLLALGPVPPQAKLAAWVLMQLADKGKPIVERFLLRRGVAEFDDGVLKLGPGLLLQPSRCDEPPKAEIRAAGITPDRIATATFMRGRGCNYCGHTGYRGRLGIFEMLQLNAAIREMTFNREPAQTIRKQAQSLGMRTLLEDGVNKALRGITTLEQVLSNCHHEIETDVTH